MQVSGLILLDKILLNALCSSQSTTIMNLQPEISQMDQFSISFGVDKTKSITLPWQCYIGIFMIYYWSLFKLIPLINFRLKTE